MGPLLLWACAAALLTLSFAVPPALALWRALDTAIFSSLNGTIGWSESMAAVWAIGNETRFRAFAILVVFVAYLVHLSREHGPGFRHDMALGLAAAAVPMAFLAMAVLLPAILRDAPVTVWAGTSHILADTVQWSEAGRSETARLPALHAVAAGSLAALLWLGFDRTFGLLSLALFLAFALPRIAAGDEWASDSIAGGGVAAFAALALARGTPLLAMLYRLALIPSGILIDGWERIFRTLSNDDREGFHPAKQVLRGMCIGAADLVPGVSGGTMALILGVYRRLISAIAHLDGTLLRHLRRFEIVGAARHIDFLFVLPIGIGVLLSLLIFSRIIPFSLLMHSFPEPTFGFFFGLILASTIGLLSHVKVGGWRGLCFIAAGICFGLTISLLVPLETPDAIWFIFLCGMAAVFALLVPGISGAFVLLILGKYAQALEALGRVDLSFILPMVAGIISGALIFSRAISWLLDHYYRQTMLTVIGVLFGTLLTVWPFKDRQYELVGGKERLVSAMPYIPLELNAAVVSGAIALLAGILLYRLLDRLAQHSGDEAA